MTTDKVQKATLTQTQYPMFKKIFLFLLLAACMLPAQRANAQCNGTPPEVEIAPPAQISCQNPVVQLSATVTPPGNYTIDWSGPVSNNGILNPTVSTPGFYSLFVFDSLTGCWGGDTVFVTQDGTIPIVTISPGNADCDASVTLTATVAPGGLYTYEWSNNANSAAIEVGINGTYCVTVTETNLQCTVVKCFTLNQPAPLSAAIHYTNTFVCGDSSVLYVQTTGGQFPLSFLWNNGNTTSVLFDPPVGVYTVTVTDNAGCSVQSAYVVEDNLDECAQLQGTVLADWNTNCTEETSDEAFSGIVVRIINAQGEVQFAYSDANGAYDIELYPGTYDVSVIPPNNLWEPCQSVVSISLTPNQTLTQDFLLKPTAICPAMTIDLSIIRLRRCWVDTYWVNYCNKGTLDANDAYVEILFDPFLDFLDAEIPHTDLGNNLYRFDLGTVPFDSCGSFWIYVKTDCNAELGQTHCSEAVIYPTGTCEPPNAQWSGASLEINAQCLTDTLDFTIKNAGTGDMDEPLEYVIIEDAVMLMQAPPPAILLAQGESYHVKVPANGSTWRVEVEQAAFHPGNSKPRLSVEGCADNGQFSTGFVNQFPVDDNDPWVDIDCTENVGSWDPNDKQGFPTGYKSAHYIEPGTDIEYLIRFQNTGTDTAFTVVIRDELSPWLDPGSVAPGASSHPYEFEYYSDRRLKFTFDNIMLPDSNVNLEGSQGFVSFRVSQIADVPLETDIFNQAAIFFDFNPPVYTNTTVHRVGEDFVSVSAWQPFLSGLTLRVMPNPVAQSAVLQLEGLPAYGDWQAELLDVNGRPVRIATVNGDRWHFVRGDLPAGIYILRVVAGEKMLGTGKVILR